MKHFISTIFMAVALLGATNVAISDEFKTIKTRDGVTISFVKNTPLKGIRSAAILFAGGDGNIGIDVDKKTIESENFLVRSRKLFSDHGILTITPDTPSDLVYIKNRRHLLNYRTDISLLIDEIRNDTSKPIWLIGTSRGAITVGYHAANLKIQGVVLTATVTEGDNDTIWDTKFRNIKVPALIVHHKYDQCFVSPFSGAKKVFEGLSSSSNRHLLSFDNGEIGSGRECGPTTFHGFLGIENQVIGDISEWIIQAIE